MINLSKKNIVKVSNETGFIKDNVEKVMRLIDILETIFSSKWKDKLVLKGGTAINLFYADLPRLSVDIDMDYTGKTKEEMLADKEDFRDYLKSVLFQKGYSLSEASKTHYALDSYVFQYINNGGNKDNIKVETNFMDRAHILHDEKKTISALDYDGNVEISVMNKYELYGSKFAALIDRGKPRDIYDVSRAIDLGILDHSQLLKKCFIFYNCIGDDASILDKNYTVIDEVTPRDFKTMLKPVLAKKEKFDYDAAKVKIKKFLDGLLIFSDSEKAFVEKFKENEYKPELLFDTFDYSDIAVRVGWHPMAYWRCQITETEQGQKQMDEALRISILMKERGIESITSMSDRDVIESAARLSKRHSNDFNDLYYGKNVYDNEDKNIRRLMVYLAAFCGDKERLLKIFKTSGQFNADKPIEYYDKIAEEQIKFIKEIDKDNKVKHDTSSNFSQKHFGKSK